MFKQLLQTLSNPGSLFDLHPEQVVDWLERRWIELSPSGGAKPVPMFLGEPPTVVDRFGKPSGTTSLPTSLFNGTPKVGLPWHHLIYAYLIENTGAYEIFAEVIRRGVQGELLEVQETAAAAWLRTTEELFFRDPPLYSVHGVTSHLRPDLRVVRRNAYWRMFGLDVTHPIPARWAGNAAGGQAWKQDVGLGVNSSFKDKLTELMRQVSIGFDHRTTTSDPNPTDPSYIWLLLRDLSDMLRTRRRAGGLAREEYYSVAAMSWLDVALSSDASPIVLEFKARNIPSKADRLSLIAQKVGMTPAPRSLELFQLAPQLSCLLRLIELGVFTSPGTAELLYRPAPGIFLSEMMRNIINLWQSATGERVKDRSVTVHPGGSAQPLRIPTAQPVVAPRNGELMRGGVN